MPAEMPGRGTTLNATLRGIAPGVATDLLSTLVVAAGICWSIAFVVIGLQYELQLYADGSMFSYSIAVQDAWAYHWHNISGRVFVYLMTYVPAELYVEVTRHARGGIVIYGMLFFATQLAGLIATWVADRSRHRIIFSYACGSAACLCPLVFGFPTEMWVAHALFWPSLASCHYAGRGIGGSTLVFAMLLALILTHEAALILLAVIQTTLLLRGIRDPAFLRAGALIVAVVSIWVFVKVTLPPDAHDAPMMRRAALQVFDIKILADYIILLLTGSLAIYSGAFLIFRQLGPARPHLYAALLAMCALTVYWIWFDHSLHADQRYPMRTVLLVAVAALGGLAAAYALDAEGRLNLPLPFQRRLMARLASDSMARAAVGAIVIVMLVHAVETAKFVSSWMNYKSAVRALAMGSTSDPALGDSQFVSLDRIDAELRILSWSSTTPYLSVLLAPGLKPRRLVVDPTAGYFWLSCETATSNENADRAVPADSRRLVRVHACLHR
jgi:hypothetical protein